jgi:hypothetical protein
MKKIILFNLSILVAIVGHTCTCLGNQLIYDFEKAAFVAKVRVIKVTPDPQDSDNHLLKIEIQELYKGDSTNQLVLHSGSNSSCAMMVNENTEWIIYAGRLINGNFSFGLCSRHTAISNIYPGLNMTNNPEFQKKHEQNIQRQIGILRFLKSLKNIPRNDFNLKTHFDSKDSSLRGYDLPVGSFAVYQIQINNDLTIKKVKTIKAFLNKDLHKKLGHTIKEELKIRTINRNITQIEKPTELLLIIYYFAKEGSEKSFVTNWDLL